MHAQHPILSALCLGTCTRGVCSIHDSPLSICLAAGSCTHHWLLRLYPISQRVLNQKGWTTPGQQTTDSSPSQDFRSSLLCSSQAGLKLSTCYICLPNAVVTGSPFACHKMIPSAPECSLVSWIIVLMVREENPSCEVWLLDFKVTPRKWEALDSFCVKKKSDLIKEDSLKNLQ